MPTDFNTSTVIPGPADSVLGQSEAGNRAAVEHAREAVYLVDARSGRVLSANPAFLRMTGYEADEIARLSIFDFVAHDPASIEVNLARCIKDGEANLGVRRWRRKDGHIRFVEVHETVVPFGGSQAACIVAYDVTERIRTERQLKINAARLERRNRQLALISAINRAVSANLSLADLLATLGHEIRPLVAVDTVTLLRQQGASEVLVEANWPDEAVAMVGTSLAPADPWEARMLFDLTEPLVLDRLLAERIGKQRQDLRETGIHSMMVIPVFVRDARYGVLALSSRRANAFGPEAAELLALVGAQVCVALANIESVRALEELARLKSEFVAIASHELRTPVSVAMGYAKLLATPALTCSEDERLTYSQRLNDACERLGKLVEELLDLSRLEDGKVELDIEEISVLEAIAEVSPLLSVRHPGRHVVLPLTDACIQADAGALERVLLNLLDNAFKYGIGPAEPLVRWGVASAPDRIRVEVANDGEEFSSEDASRLFGRFSRLPRHQGIAGTGIGLFAARAVIEQMGGEMGAQSSGGQVVFWFELPGSQSR